MTMQCLLFGINQQKLTEFDLNNNPLYQINLNKINGIIIIGWGNQLKSNYNLMIFDREMAFDLITYA